MRAATLLRQLIACPAQLCSAGQAAAAAATVSGRQLLAHSLHTSAQPSADAAHADQDATSHSQQQQQAHQQQAWAPPRGLPPPSTYGLQINIKAHDLLYVKLASTAIRDLILVHVAPKSREVLPRRWKNGEVGAPWVNLAMPVGDRAIPTRRTHFTVISGPHVHKTAREQFARTTHTRVIEVGTNNLSELDWLLHSIKMYKFVGVELSMRITSSSYLLPTSTSQQDAAQQPLLAGHKQRFAHLFGAAAPSSDTSSSSSYAVLQRSLQGLRSDLYRGLLQQRVRLGASKPYELWQGSVEGQQAAAAAAGGAQGASKPSEQQLRDAVAQQVQGSGLLGAAEGGDSSSSSDSSSREQALLAALDRLLGDVDTQGLDRHKFFPYFMAFYSPERHQPAPAEWMQALLMYGKHRQAQVEQQQQQQQPAEEAFRQYGEVSKAAVLLALQQWHATVDRDSRRQLVMPDAGQTDGMSG